MLAPRQYTPQGELMLQAIRSASGLISVVFFFIAVGSEGWPAMVCSTIIAVLFAIIELEEAHEMGFFQEGE